MLYTSYGTPISYETAATRYEVGVSAAQYTSFPSSRTRVEDHTAWTPEMGTAFITPFDPPEVRALKYGADPFATGTSSRPDSFYLRDSEFIREALGQGKAKKATPSPKRKQSLRRLLKNAIKQSCREIMKDLKEKRRGTSQSS
ncbi:hypothetical protein CCMSSC00406_0000271 [Pleurotus cornucopiae]|uniref:Uncharacterized protein n=1 Tax=Pleurotus cornucopiae TaxID=5321 RepID=A0ACB7IXZ5_PLECO|nr:hypothetical protein CCMSSC00406_0000271 [Pleurotus cornucopiae]